MRIWEYESRQWQGVDNSVFTNGTRDCPGHSDTLRPNSIWFLQVVYSWAWDRLLGLMDVEIHCSSAWSVSGAQGAGRSPQPSPVTPDPFRPVSAPQDLEHLVCRCVSWSFQRWWKRAPSIWPACQGSPKDGAVSIACLYQAWGEPGVGLGWSWEGCVWCWLSQHFKGGINRKTQPKACIQFPAPCLSFSVSISSTVLDISHY